MDPTLEQLAAAAILAALAYAGATCTCATLAARLKGQKSRHMLVVESKRRRIQYLAEKYPPVQIAEADVVEEDEAVDASVQTNEPPPLQQAA